MSSSPRSPATARQIERLALAIEAPPGSPEEDAYEIVGCSGGWFSNTAEQDLARLRRLGLFGLRAARGATNVAVRTAELGVMVGSFNII